jgi:hypothetical protein
MNLSKYEEPSIAPIQFIGFGAIVLCREIKVCFDDLYLTFSYRVGKPCRPSRVRANWKRAISKNKVLFGQPLGYQRVGWRLYRTRSQMPKGMSGIEKLTEGILFNFR